MRTYFHHAIRLSYVLPDLARITNPCLNIIDALTGQWGREWNGEGRVCDALIAGDQIVATDTVGATLMGHDPTSDWPTPPFRRDRNHLRVAAEGGFGTVDLSQIDSRPTWSRRWPLSTRRRWTPLIPSRAGAGPHASRPCIFRASGTAD